MPGHLSRDRYIGCMVGVAVGDALGAPLEFMSRAEIAAAHGEVRELIGGGWLNVDAGEWTDDTQMTLAVAESIVARGGIDPREIARRFVAWAATNPKDIGNITRMAIRYHEQGVAWDAVGPRVCAELAGRCAGNGSLMRCAPIGLLRALDTAALVRDSILTSSLTHSDPLATWSTVAVNLAVAELVAGRREQLVERVAAQIGSDAVRTALLAAPGLARDAVRSGGYVLETLSAAIWALMNHDGFEAVVVAAVNLGGDADTVGAVAGALAGAREGVNGIPERWIRQLREAERLAHVAVALYHLARQRPSPNGSVRPGESLPAPGRLQPLDGG